MNLPTPYHDPIFSDLEGQTVLITGGGSGIGASLVLGFLRQGCCVHVVDLNSAPLLALAGPEPHDRLRIWHEDVTSKGVFERILEEGCDNKVDVLVNNVANDLRHSIEELPVEEWPSLIEVNLMAGLYATRAIATGMCQRNHGAIVNIGSNSAMMGMEGLPLYVACKGAVHAVTKSLARTYGHYDVRVNGLVPGWVFTDKQQRLWATPEDVDRCLSEQALKRRLIPEDMISPVLFLASQASRSITGTLLVADGGRT
ncbi:MAG: SDR family oxidoreductase [Alphaproteobacteria bacterium]|nr:SDR family oxidoreductase [Alphaproteobacteria bacterium]